MRREAASTRVVPRVALVPVGRGFFCGLGPAVPLVTRHDGVSRELRAVRVKPGGTASGPRPEQARAIALGSGFWVIGVGRNGDDATPHTPKTYRLTPITPGRAGCG